MADVRPFRGLRYNQAIVGELSDIVCPPFDTIPAELQTSLQHRSPFNVVRLELGDHFPTDTPQDNRYTRTAELLQTWLEGEVLLRERLPAYYLVRHSFQFRGSERARLELIGCVRLEEYQRRAVLPHEFTRDEDKRDRLALMQACHANISPIMCLYRDDDGGLSAVLDRMLATAPLVEFSDPGDQSYQVWKIEDPGLTDEIGNALYPRPLYIADGHHRYETALNYRDLAVSERGGSQTGEEAFNFVIMGLIGFEDPGLLVLPYHRVVGGLTSDALGGVKRRLAALFDSEPMSRDGDGTRGLLEEIEARGKDRLVMGLLDSEGSGAQLLSLRGGAGQGAWGLLGRSEAWILEQQVLKPALGDSLEQAIAYVHDGEEAAELVATGQYQLGFLLKPFPLDLFETIVNSGERLPPKSTFFYPKLATGLVINTLEGNL